MNEDMTQVPLAAGTVLQGAATYTIESVLGRGGFGITYLATTEVLWANGATMRRRVAVKEHFYQGMSERGADGLTVETPGTSAVRATVAGSLDDFIAEAGRLQSLAADSPNIVHVSEVFRANGTAYYAMEYLEGVSLGAAVKGRPVAESVMLSVMRPIIGAVAYLHGQRMIHLDIKPDNIVLADGGARPVLIDFGQSKHFRADGHATSTVNVKGLSHGYAPMEQYDGIRTFVPGVDVYALGATMMACLTGAVPPKALEWQPAQKARDIAALPASDATKAVITCALAADPADRYPDAAAMLAALTSQAMERRFLCKQSASRFSTSEPDQAIANSNATRRISSTPPVSKPSKPNRRPIALATAAIIAGLLILGAAAYFLFVGHHNEPTPNAPADSTLIAEEVEVAEGEAVPVEEAVVVEEGAIPVEEAVVVEEGAAPAEEAEVPAYTPINWEALRTPRNLCLAVERRGHQYYLSESDWRSLTSDQQSECRKLGVVIKYGSEPAFILALEEAPGFYNWNKAIDSYGNRLPTKEQGEAWINQQEAVQSAVRAFGGHISGRNQYDNNYSERDPRKYYKYWTQAECDSSHAWFVSMYNGYVNYGIKSYTGRVRPVARIVESAM